MKLKIQSLVVCAIFGAAVNASAAVTYTVDPGATWFGFVNVSDVGGTGYGDAAAGGFVFPSGWGTTDLRANFSGSNLSLQANTIGDPDPFWYTPSGGPGATGNKIIEANFYQEINGGLGGQTVTLTGNVLSNDLTSGPVDAAGRGWTGIAFIKDFAPDYSTFVESSTPLVNGVFSIDLATIDDPARHIQIGFQVTGPNVWAGDPLSANQVLIAPVPEPGSMTLAGFGIALLMLRRRKR